MSGIDDDSLARHETHHHVAARLHDPGMRTGDNSSADTPLRVGESAPAKRYAPKSGEYRRRAGERLHLGLCERLES